MYVFDHDSDDDNDCEDDYGVNEDDADDDHGDQYEGDDIVKGLKRMIVVMMWKRGVTWQCVLVALCQMGEGSGKLDPSQAPEQNLAFKILQLTLQETQVMTQCQDEFRNLSG